jgi:hypothetical protein
MAYFHGDDSECDSSECDGFINCVVVFFYSRAFVNVITCCGNIGTHTTFYCRIEWIFAEKMFAVCSSNQSSSNFWSRSFNE